MKKALRISAWVLALLLLLLLGAVVAIQSPTVQTALARKVAAKVNAGIDGELTIGRVQVLPFKTLILRDVVLTDNDPLSTSFFEPRDTVARVGIATVSVSLKGLTGKKPITLDKVIVRDGKLNLVTEGHHLSNLKRIFHLPDPEPMKIEGEVLTGLLLFFFLLLVVSKLQHQLTGISRA